MSVEEHVMAGRARFKAGEFLQAAQELERAYAKEQRPIFLFNMAQAYRRAGMEKVALARYQLMLQVDPKTPLRMETEGYIRELKALLEEQARSEKERQQRERIQQQLLSEEKTLKAVKQDLDVTRRRAIQAERRSKVPVYRQRWFWGVMGAALAVTVGASIGLGVALAPGDPDTIGGTFPVTF
jgi:tetratricopeptide (TPR) repeat protein